VRASPRETQAKRLADEYDAAQERGEVAKSGDTLRNGPIVPERNAGDATAADVGLSRRKSMKPARVSPTSAANPTMFMLGIETWRMLP